MTIVERGEELDLDEKRRLLDCTILLLNTEAMTNFVVPCAINHLKETTAATPRGRPEEFEGEILNHK